jgi:hypothetical protein
MAKLSYLPGELNPGAAHRSGEPLLPENINSIGRSAARKTTYEAVRRKTKPGAHNKQVSYKGTVLHSYYKKIEPPDPQSGDEVGLARRSMLACLVRIESEHGWLPNPLDPNDSTGWRNGTPDQEIIGLYRPVAEFVDYSGKFGENNTVAIPPLAGIEVNWLDRKNRKYGVILDIKGIPNLNPAFSLLGAMASFALGSPLPAGALPGGEYYGTGTPSGASADANAFIAKMKASPHLKDFSDVLLAGLAANAQKESAFCPENAGDARGDIATGNAKYAISSKNCSGRKKEYCSFGYWQMNICAKGAGGQRFAEHFKIDLMDKKTLHAAITDPEKQFEVIAKEMINLFGDDVYKEGWDGWTGAKTAEWFGQEIAEKYERCSHCYKGDTSWVERGNVAADIFNKYLAPLVLAGASS